MKSLYQNAPDLLKSAYNTFVYTKHSVKTNSRPFTYVQMAIIGLNFSLQTQGKIIKRLHNTERLRNIKYLN